MSNKQQGWDQAHYQLQVSLSNWESSIQRLENDLKIIGTPRDNPQFRDDMKRHLNATTQSAQDIRMKLGDLISAEKSGSTGFQKNVRRQDVRKFSEQIQVDFEKLQRLANESKTKQERYPLPESDSNVSNFSVWSRNRRDEEDDERAGLVESEKRQQLALLEEERKTNQRRIQQRDKDIRDIESKVVEINEIFRDVQHLVTDQGQMIDDIESNMTTAEQRTDLGVQELHKANEATSSGNRKILCFAFVILIISMILIIIILFTTGSV